MLLRIKRLTQVKLYSLVFYSLILLPISCSKKNGLEKVIVNNCFWDIYYEKYDMQGQYCWSFFSDNRCKYFVNDHSVVKKGTRFVRPFEYDGRPDIWEIKGDTLEARFSAFRIISYTTDTIKLISFTSNDSLMLVKNCNTEIYK